MTFFEEKFVKLTIKNLAALSSLLLVVLFSVTVYADTWVNGYMKSNGTYVSGHYRSSPDNTTDNNWSTRGNVNPYTGRIGTRNPSSYGDNSGVRNRSWDRLKNRTGRSNR